MVTVLLEYITFKIIIMVSVLLEYFDLLNIFSQTFPIVLALCLMLLATCYAQNYASRRLPTGTTQKDGLATACPNNSLCCDKTLHNSISW